MHITTCTKCGKAFEANSEESANEPGRICIRCFNMKAAMERFNTAVLTADKRLCWAKDEESPEVLFTWLCRLDYHHEARELLEAGKPLGYFKTWTDAEFKQ